MPFFITISMVLLTAVFAKINASSEIWTPASHQSSTPTTEENYLLNKLQKNFKGGTELENRLFFKWLFGKKRRKKAPPPRPKWKPRARPPPPPRKPPPPSPPPPPVKPCWEAPPQAYHPYAKLKPYVGWHAPYPTNPKWGIRRHPYNNYYYSYIYV